MIFGSLSLQLFWPRIVLKKWFNINNKASDFGADPDEGEIDSDSDNGEISEKKLDEPRFDSNGFETIIKRRRRNSATFRTQYINTKELKVCVGTWNLGGILPPDDLDIKDWLDTDELADIYVLGFQEIVPLNAGNIFGAEDRKPVQKWENIIRETLNRIQPLKTKTFKCYSAPPSPSRINMLNDLVDIKDEILSETDSDDDDDDGVEIYPLYDESKGFDEEKDGTGRSDNDLMSTEFSNCGENAELGTSREQDLETQFSSPKRLDRLNSPKTEDSIGNSEASVTQQKKKLTRTLSGIERICLSWPEPPLNLIGQHVLERPNSFRSVKSFKQSKSFETYSSSNSSSNKDKKRSPETDLIRECDLEPIIPRKRSPFVRIVSKQMVGIFISIWVRRSLRSHIHNLKVSTVGVGVMGYIGNKGSVSVSMSIYQTPFCFICTHLTSGEKDGDELRRNADVQEIHRRTYFHSVSGIGLPKTIRDHERIIWFGDLNYRINLSYEKTRQLISKKEWSSLLEKDQLVKEFKKGCAFDGWTEGTLNFPPTYKYELNSEKYCGEDPKAGRRNPAWCDRILSFGKGMRLLSYRRTEKKLSDHRPVIAIYMAEVEVFCHRKLKKALTITDAELEDEDVLQDMEFNIGMSRLRLGEDISGWER
ncbi:Inositol polyphosphate-related phosphatase [Macleaya cordata]|uniref:Inositol polyphosphate-related phosphatase n=1 Tax=Macleaya cordata TaxID=56857 RepID=A0A200QJJ7_MACCD|nr:Inositol polyphosphate-related phosphatase [Macleaya cordata]